MYHDLKKEVLKSSFIYDKATDSSTLKGSTLESDIVFSNVVGNCGILKAGDYLEGKGYVEMTSINPKDSQDICEMIRSKGGRYLEAQVQGSKREADDGTLVVLTAGDQALFLDCQSCFKAMGKTSFYLGPAGAASKASLILQIIKGPA
uniref:Oxidoreductase GLYR1 homolog n=1 Tax=Diabrotica virgifera virgifera TaxID=50390 RepID=A0A6P7FV83_DIAVI